MPAPLSDSEREELLRLRRRVAELDRVPPPPPPVGRDMLLESVLHNISDGIIVTDERGGLILANPAASRVLGKRLEPNGESHSPWLTPLFLKDGVTPVAEEHHPLTCALRGETVLGENLRLGTSTGVPRWLNVRAGPLLAPDGTRHGAVLVFHDESTQRSTLEALRESLDRFNLMVDGSKVGLWDIQVGSPSDPFSPDNPLYYSPHFKQILGFNEEEFPDVLASWANLVHPDDRVRVFQALADHIYRHVPYDIEYRMFNRQGEIRWLSARGQASWAPSGQPVRMSGSFIDITPRKQIEERLRANEEFLQSILWTTPSIVYVKSLEGRYEFVNRAYEDLFGIHQRDVIGKSDHEFFPAEVAEQLRDNDLRVIQADSDIQFEEHVPSRGEQHTYLSVKFPLHRHDGTIRSLCGISTDITERIQNEARLRQEQDFLRRLIRAHERDRQLLAYEIHDGLVQDITASVWQLESLGHAWADRPEPERDTLAGILAVLRRAIQDARRVLSGLRPPILDEAGVVLAIQYLIAEPSPNLSIAIEFIHDVEFQRLESLLEGTIFRIVQEALTNLRRHSQASEAKVLLLQREETLWIEIHDNGQGFDPAAVPPDRFGLQGIRKRASLLGGEASIESAPGQGTHIIVRLPIVPAERAASEKSGQKN